MIVATVLGSIAVALSLAAVVSYQWVTLVPRLGIGTLYHLRAVRIAVATAAIGLALLARRLDPGQGWRYLIPVLVLTPFSGALHATRVLVPLDDPGHVDADAAGIDDGEMVVGCVVDGQAHAWQVRTLVPHHVVHDVVAGRPVVAAWCAVCASGVVYDGTVDGRPLHFDPEAVWRRNMIVRDRETGTLWQHATGEALAGPLAGEHLDVLGGRLLTWSAWKDEHPDTTITRHTTAEEWRGLLSKSTTTKLLTDWGVPTAVVPPGLSPDDDRLDPLAEVIGLVVDGRATTYPVATAADRGRIEDRVAGHSVVISYDPNGRSAEVRVDGRPVEFKRTRWLEWFEFHPGSRIYGQE